MVVVAVASKGDTQAAEQRITEAGARATCLSLYDKPMEMVVSRKYVQVTKPYEYTRMTSFVCLCAVVIRRKIEKDMVRCSHGQPFSQHAHEVLA